MQKINVIKFFIFLVIFFFVTCNIANAQNKNLTLSITPPLIKNNVNPGQIWKSSIKLINNNAKEINAYVQVVDFKGGKENGTVSFIYDIENLDSAHLLSKWIIIENKTIVIPAFSSKEISFIIDVPETAGPGGHYAAILAGTQPPKEKASGSSIKISSLLASLILLNVNGDVNEKGSIREFSTSKKVFSEPNIDFTLRFKNDGNVHVLPQGNIKIYNYSNEEKGLITINKSLDFGNVLPGEIRKWKFNWKDKASLLNMGRYRAELVVGYGAKNHQTDYRTLYFWIINFKLLAYIGGGLLFVILLIIIFVRLSIKRAIKNTKEIIDYKLEDKKLINKKPINIIKKINNKQNKIVDLRDKNKHE